MQEASSQLQELNKGNQRDEHNLGELKMQEQQLKEEVEDKKNLAKRVCEEVVETNRNPETVSREMSLQEAEIEKMENVHGTREFVQQEYFNRRRHYDEVKGQVDGWTMNVDKLHKVLSSRVKQYARLQGSISSRVRFAFQRLLSERSFNVSRGRKCGNALLSKSVQYCIQYLVLY